MKLFLDTAYEEARRFSHLNIPVLILGERGTGKTTLASWIRFNSPFRKKELDSKWPVVACGQYASHTMRAELFGYKKGAFTDAYKDKEGLLAVVDNDTLFLDEIGDISRDLQRLIIKAIEEKQYLPLGEQQPCYSNFRLITATNVPWSDLQSKLDADFLDRISPLQLKIPALREIPDDIPWLWQSVYLQAIKKSAISSLPKLNKKDQKDIVRKLQAHPLPGNMRDLFRVAYRLIAVLGDPLAPLPLEKAIDYAIAGLETQQSIQSSQSFVKSIATAFAKSQSLHSLLPEGEKLCFTAIDKELKHYLATQIRNIARYRKVNPEEICDVTDRTLRTWLTFGK